MPNQELFEKYLKLKEEYLKLKEFNDYQIKHSKKPIHVEECRICFKKLSGKQREFCSDNCRNQNKQIKNKFHELKEKNPKLNLIFWNQESNPNGKLEWRTITGVENKPKYKIIKKIITKKKGKTASKELKRF